MSLFTVLHFPSNGVVVWVTGKPRERWLGQRAVRAWEHITASILKAIKPPFNSAFDASCALQECKPPLVERTNLFISNLSRAPALRSRAQETKGQVEQLPTQLWQWVGSQCIVPTQDFFPVVFARIEFRTCFLLLEWSQLTSHDSCTSMRWLQSALSRFNAWLDIRCPANYRYAC